MHELLTSYQFKVMIGADQFGFTRISNLIQEMEYDSIAEGGRNEGPLLFRKPKSRLDILVMEGGVKKTPSQNDQDTFVVGKKITGLILYVGADLNRPYTFDSGIVTKVELDHLDAMVSNILIRKVEIAHNGLFQVKQKK